MALDVELTRRLRQEAERIEVDDPPVSRLARRGARRFRLRRTGAVVGIVAVLAGAFTVGRLTLLEETRPQLLRQNSGLLPAPMPAEGEGAFSPVVPGDAPAARPAPEGIGVGARIVKTGTLRLEVPDGRFGAALQEAQRVVAAHGGFLTASSTAGEEARSGALTLRVPARAFEETVADLKALGEVRGEHLRGEDVTSEFVDLRARLRNWRAQERVLLGLMREAASIDESIRVQGELQDVQLEIERIRGQLRVLGDRTALATIRVEIREAGVVPAAEAGALGTAWDRALAGAVDVVAAVIVGLGYLLPIAGLSLLLWLAARAARARRPA